MKLTAGFLVKVGMESHFELDNKGVTKGTLHGTVLVSGVPYTAFITDDNEEVCALMESFEAVRMADRSINFVIINDGDSEFIDDLDKCLKNSDIISRKNIGGVRYGSEARSQEKIAIVKGKARPVFKNASLQTSCECVLMMLGDDDPEYDSVNRVLSRDEYLAVDNVLFFVVLNDFSHVSNVSENNDGSYSLEFANLSAGEIKQRISDGIIDSLKPF